MREGMQIPDIVVVTRRPSQWGREETPLLGLAGRYGGSFFPHCELSLRGRGRVNGGAQARTGNKNVVDKGLGVG
jgi:hypothetical protein